MPRAFPPAAVAAAGQGTGPVRIRVAKHADATVLHSLIRDAMRLYAEASGVPGGLESLQEEVADVERHIREDLVFVAEYAHGEVLTVVGTLRLSRDSGRRSAYLSRFAVDPELQRIGVGGALMHAVDLFASAGGIRTVRLHTAMSNLPLIRFYRARGFEGMDSESSRGYPRALLEKSYPASRT